VIQSKGIKQYFWRWILRRSPLASSVELRHRSIYVLPTPQGWMFLLVLLIMWLLGTNYQNNLILAITFLLIGMGLVSILYTFRNLSGLQLQGLGARSVFTGELVEWQLRLSSRKTYHHDNLCFGLANQYHTNIDLAPGEERVLTLAEPSSKRGWMKVGRILVESRFPFGLMRAWSWVHLEMEALIYPRPIASEEPPLGIEGEGEGDLIARDNPEDFYGFDVYRPGASLAQVAWKQYARGAGLHLKEYVGYQSQNLWLDWYQLAGLDTESRLSRLCYWSVELGKTSNHYGLRLPGQTIELGQGHIHQESVLRALALYQDSAVEGSR
jgi:uncharacterized protein (DUF58 family)